MPSFLCFICHSTVNADTNEEIREKYREVIGMHLCMDSHLCYICCHVLHRLWLFRSVCLKRSLEYPVLFSEKGTLNLQRNELEIHTICSEDICGQFHSRNLNSKTYNFSYECADVVDSQECADNQYVELMDDRNEEYSRKGKTVPAEEKFDTDQTYNEFNDSPYDKEQDFESHRTGDSCDNNESVTYNNNELTDGNTALKSVNVCRTGETKENTKAKAKKKSKKDKKRTFEKITLTVEEQKRELENRRKEKKYLEAEFKCYNCALGFLFKDSYQTHMMRHEESNGEYRCAICKLRFASGAVLRAHAATHGERYRCARCGAAVGARARGTHARRCGGGATGGGASEGVACHLCGRLFQDSAGLQQHLKRFHQLGSSRRVYTCSSCGNSYGNQAALRTHMIKHVNKKFSCEQCGAEYSSPYTLNQHKKRHGGGSEGLGGGSERNEHNERNERHYCPTCEVSYSSRKSLLAHVRNSGNHQRVLFECPICGRASPNQRSLALHMEAVHSGAKHYACPHCAARYTNRKSLVRHIGTHQGKGQLKDAVCHLCGASFKGNSKLNRHLREVCEKAKLEEELVEIYEQGCLNPG